MKKVIMIQVAFLLLAVIAGGIMFYFLNDSIALAKSGDDETETMSQEMLGLRETSCDEVDPEVLDDDNESEDVLNPVESLTLNDTTRYERMLNQSVDGNTGFPMVSYNGVLKVQLLPEDDVINASDINAERLIEELNEVASMQNGENAIHIARLVNALTIAMEESKLSNVKKDFELAILRYRYGEKSEEEVMLYATAYQRCLDEAIETLRRMQGID